MGIVHLWFQAPDSGRQTRCGAPLGPSAETTCLAREVTCPVCQEMMRKDNTLWIIVTGNIVRGFNAWGPFNHVLDARRAREKMGKGGCVIKLWNPNDAG